MSAQTEEIIAALKEFLSSAKEDETKGRLRSAITMYFKTIVDSCDFLIYDQILKIPENHADRYAALQKYFPEIYKLTSIHKA